MDTKKLTSEELETLKEFQQKNNAVVSELGNLEVAKLQMETRRQEILDFYNELKEDELKFGKKFSTKYGAGSINIETGEFTPSTQAEETTEKASF
jgi:MoaA/NifB/PqqE/SkfB family radical SAM enzyme